MRTACGKRRGCGAVISPALHIYLAVDNLVLVNGGLAVNVCARRGLGEVAVRSVEVYCLATAIGGIYRGSKIVPFFLIARLGRDTEGGRAIREVGWYRRLRLKWW